MVFVVMDNGLAGRSADFQALKNAGKKKK